MFMEHREVTAIEIYLRVEMAKQYNSFTLKFRAALLFEFQPPPGTVVAKWNKRYLDILVSYSS